MIKLRGYTLIEMLIVVVIVGILATIMVPAYNKQMERGRRTDAKACIMDIASREERFYTQYSSYTPLVEGAGGCAGWACGLNTGTTQCKEGLYTVAVATTPAGCSAETGQTPCIGFTITATPISGNDDDCTTLSLQNTGVEGSTGNGTTDFCWR